MTFFEKKRLLENHTYFFLKIYFFLQLSFCYIWTTIVWRQKWESSIGKPKELMKEKETKKSKKGIQLFYFFIVRSKKYFLHCNTFRGKLFWRKTSFSPTALYLFTSKLVNAGWPQSWKVLESLRTCFLSWKVLECPGILSSFLDCLGKKTPANFFY